MSKKRKKGLVRKAQVRQRILLSEKGLDCTPNTGAQMARRIPRSYAGVHITFNNYFLAHPTIQSASLGEILEYLAATNTLTPRPSQSSANEVNDLGKTSTESELPEPSSESKASSPPAFGECMLLLVLTKAERVNIPGDLEEEFRGIAAKHGARYAKFWYYKQVAASAWPMIRKAIWMGLLTWVGEWIRSRS